MNKQVIERTWPGDKRVKPQTIAHHVARYKFACEIQEPCGRALDLCSGEGYGTAMLMVTGYNATGMDISGDMISEAKTKYPDCRFLQGDITKGFIPLVSGFSLITLFEAIEHIKFSQGKQLLADIYELLKPGGIAIISTPRDINDKYNTFHISEWSYGTLKNECGSVFDEVKIYGQDWEHGKISDENVRDNDFYICVCKKHE